MTEKDLDEFENEFGFKLLPTSFKKPLSEITKEEYREQIECLYNAIINDNSNDDDLMIEERIDTLIKVYEGYIDENNQSIKKHKNLLIEKLDDRNYGYPKLYVEIIEEYMRENELFEMFIESLKYAKTGEIK
nr:MAG TPA: hypothetical protein [Caudoviricetes sp.]